MIRHEAASKTDAERVGEVPAAGSAVMDMDAFTLEGVLQNRVTGPETPRLVTEAFLANTGNVWIKGTRSSPLPPEERAMIAEADDLRAPDYD